MLQSRQDIEQEFLAYEILLSRQIAREVVEGKAHNNNGMAGVVQSIARKKAKLIEAACCAGG